MCERRAKLLNLLFQLNKIGRVEKIDNGDVKAVTYFFDRADFLVFAVSLFNVVKRGLCDARYCGKLVERKVSFFT